MNKMMNRIKQRISFMSENKVNAFSPTISPAPKSKATNEIESIREGLSFYYDKGCKELVVQKKYMGSYCDIYLCKNIEDSYFISRNGHKITYIDRDEALEACRYIYDQFDWNEIKMVIIQSELMPWSALGENLINNDFYAYLSTQKRHHNYLSTSNLYEKIEKVKNGEQYLSFVGDSNQLSNNKLRSKYPNHIIRQFNALQDMRLHDLDKYKKGIDKYEKQIDHFGKAGQIKFEAFNILKIVYQNGEEEIPNDNLTYNKVNQEKCRHLILESENDLTSQAEVLQEWFHDLQSEMEEGIMIKPRKAFVKNIPPALKVRNNDYLTMIYGVHFEENLEYNVKKRKIGRKLKCSTNDWMINWELLKIPYKSINSENYYYKNLLLDRIDGEIVENKLDFRL